VTTKMSFWTGQRAWRVKELESRKSKLGEIYRFRPRGGKRGERKGADSEGSWVVEAKETAGGHPVNIKKTEESSLLGGKAVSSGRSSHSTSGKKRRGNRTTFISGSKEITKKTTEVEGRGRRPYADISVGGTDEGGGGEVG